MDNLVDEIKEDLKNEQLLKIWKEYGNVIIGAVIALFLGTCGYLYWDHSQKQHRIAVTIAYEKALQETDVKEKAEAFNKLSSKNDTGYATLASFEEAELAQNPAASYRKIAQDTRHERVFRELATLKAIMKEMPTGAPHALLEEVEALTKTATPWRDMAYEIEAELNLMVGKVDQALAIFETLSKSQNAPKGVQQRSQIMLGFVKNR